MDEHPILAYLERRRAEMGLGHNAFARWLGLNPATWSQVRRGVLPVGSAFIGRVVVRCPDAALVLGGR